MIAAIYVVLTFVFAPISFGEVQIRISEMLTVLPVFYRGCHTGAVRRLPDRQYYRGRAFCRDVIFGSLATLIGAVGTYNLRNSNRFFCSASPYCGQHLYCTLCPPLCLWRGAADPLPDADGRYRRSGFLRYPG